jgi:hypothetical protein
LYSATARLSADVIRLYASVWSAVGEDARARV